MEKKNINEKFEKKLVLKIEYLDFIEKLIKDKVLVSKENKREVEILYNNIYNRKFSNIKRVIMRSNRSKVKEIKFKEMEKRKVKKEEVEKVENNLKLLSNKGSNNFIVI